MPRTRQPKPALVFPSLADLVRSHIAGARVTTVLDAYEEAAYWSSISETDPDGSGEPIDSYMAEHDTTPAPAMLAAFRYAVVVFLLTAEHAGLDLGALDQDSGVGHDIWLTRNGHGVGFWARDVSTYGDEATRDALDAIASAMGECDLYVDTETNTVDRDGPPLAWYVEQGRCP